MINNEEIIALPDHLMDHDYILPVVYEDDHIVCEEEVVEKVEESEEEVEILE